MKSNSRICSGSEKSYSPLLIFTKISTFDVIFSKKSFPHNLGSARGSI
uniref:Uncharacterized protein n=1 Tax=Thermococcus sp. IRI48 TaxID=1197734 RepID=L0B8F9_9EURY|nr:hypothetical protein i48-5 [Thermococcus sp. IRI48]